MSNYRDEDIERFAGMFKALSAPTRLRIFLQLVSCCCGQACGAAEARMCVGAVGRELPVASSTLSHHFKELRAAGLIRMQRRGKFVECWVEPRVLSQLAGFFSQGRRGGRGC